ncbi:hypothetical protein SAMN05428965_1185 [Geodermatophilus sp. DSM 45219]|nr:hypothetical protein SAMN05428965_1185 [Geodermatophilus sp. DSM 45219]
MAVPLGRTWILVLLAAVFLMHGIPSTAVGNGATPGAHAETAAGPDIATASAAHPAPDSRDGRTDHDSSSHSTASHAWNACLAVLLMGMAVLVLLVVRRSSALPDHRAPPRLPGAVSWVSPPRPPELSVLCLLRT